MAERLNLVKQLIEEQPDCIDYIHKITIKNNKLRYNGKNIKFKGSLDGIFENDEHLINQALYNSFKEKHDKLYENYPQLKEYIAPLNESFIQFFYK
jgi:hypothetical protein